MRNKEHLSNKKLTKEEKELLDSIERDEWESLPGEETEKYIDKIRQAYIDGDVIGNRNYFIKTDKK